MEKKQAASGGKSSSTPVPAKRKAGQPPALKVKEGQGVLDTSAQKKAKHNTTYKVHFDTPFALKWPPVADDVRDEVVARLSADLGEYKRVRVKKERPSKAPPSEAGKLATTATSTTDQASSKTNNKKRKKKPQGKETDPDTTKTATTSSQDTMDLESAPGGDGVQAAKRATKSAAEIEAEAAARKEAREKLIAQREEVQTKSKFLALGLNAVTKALEKKQLDVVIVCKDVEPPRLVQHIPMQAYLTDVPLVTLAGDLSLQLGAVFGMRTAMALGFKKDVEHPHAELVNFLKSKAIPLDIPWLLPAKTAQQTSSTTTVPAALAVIPMQPFRAKVAKPKQTAAKPSQQGPKKKQKQKQGKRGGNKKA